MKIAPFFLALTLWSTVNTARAQEHAGQVAFDFAGEIWQGTTVSDEDQLRFIEDLNAFCMAMQVSVEPLSASEVQWLDSVAPRDDKLNSRGVSLDHNDPLSADRIFSASAYVRESIIRAANFCIEATRALVSDFQVRPLSSRLGVLIYITADLQQSVEALETAGRRGWLLANAPGWKVDAEGRGWSEIISLGAVTTIMRISAFLGRTTY